jgi:hypothetical protein
MQKSAKDSSKGSGRGAFVVDSRVLNKKREIFYLFLYDKISKKPTVSL